MKPRNPAIDAFDIPEELRPLLARFFKRQSIKGQPIQRDVIYPFENNDIKFTHDIYVHVSHQNKWCADVLANKSFYHNDYTTGRKVIAVIHPTCNQQKLSSLVVRAKTRRAYFFLASELNSSLSIVSRFSGLRPRFYTFGNINIVSQIVQGETLFDFLNNERSFRGKVLTSSQRFRLVISIIREAMSCKLHSICNREITVKDMVYDERTNQTQFLSYRLAKMMNDASMSSGGIANAVYGAPEEFISQSSGQLITVEEYINRSSIVSHAGLAADVFMLGFACIHVWRHMYTDDRLHEEFKDYFLARAEQDWQVMPNMFEKIYDLTKDEQLAILQLSNEMLNPKCPQARPVIEDCFYRYQLLYLNHKLRFIKDEMMQAKILAANMIATGLHAELYAITRGSVYLSQCRDKIAEFKLNKQQPCRLLRQRLERYIKKDYLHELMLQKWRGTLQELNLTEEASIEQLLQKFAASVGALSVKKVLNKFISALEDHQAVIAELVEYCDLRCLFDLTNKADLLERVHQIIEQHIAMVGLFHQHAKDQSHAFLKIKYQLEHDPVTLDNLHAQAAHIARKLDKLNIEHPVIINRHLM